MNVHQNSDDTIVAPATPIGESSVAVVRVSGKKAIEIVNRHFVGSRNLTNLEGYQAAYGNFKDKSLHI